MLWLKDHKRNWRVFFLALLVVAMFGPWSFDRIAVHLPNTCSFPSIRLDDVLCTSPVSIVWLLANIPSDLNYMLSGSLAGASAMRVASEWLYVLLALFLILPFLSTLVLIIWEKQQRWSTVHRVELGLAAGSSLLVCIVGLSMANWALWGAWLYFFLVIGMLILEILATPKNN